MSLKKIMGMFPDEENSVLSQIPTEQNHRKHS